MPTIRQALAKVSELRSRAAMIEALMLHLKAHYTDDDSGEAEMKFVREDAAIVPQVHVKDFQMWLADQLDLVGAEMDEWEGMKLSPQEEEAPEVTPKVSTRKGKKAARDRDDATG